MSEMIERVAKAIWKIHSSSFSDGVGLEDDLIYEDMARAAIEAMREPTDAMFGDMPGFTAEQLREIAPAVGHDDPLRRSFNLSRPNSAGLALRSDADGGRPVLRSRFVSISRFLKRDATVDKSRAVGHLTAPELANFLAAQAVASAQGFIDGRGGAGQLAHDAERIFSELELISDPRCNAILDPTRLLLTAMIHAAVTSGPRAGRWADIMNALVGLLRLESTELARTGMQRQ